MPECASIPVFLQDIVENLQADYKCGVWTSTITGHTIFAATHPGMYKFFNVSEERKHMPMAAATTYVVLNNTAGRQVMDKLVNCSLTKKCMAPDGASLWCKQPDVFNDTYANCHRYDQSALALALAECTDDPKDFQVTSDLVCINRGIQ
uniref:Uncharacterized protein n=1 Tax=Panagrolaimus sp. JU765 TaxID=591449 RepID=A0AC34QBP0_9BILA